LLWVERPTEQTEVTMKRILSPLAASTILGLLLAACQTPPPAPVAPEPPPLSTEQEAAKAAELARTTKEQELAQALELYAQGQFMPAIIALRPLIEAPELSAAYQLQAVKYTALSHCILGQPLLCRQFFEQALQQDPRFQLADTEASHPVWGAEFRRAQRNTRSTSAPRGTDRTP
jgi:hypothetical protein